RPTNNPIAMTMGFKKTVFAECIIFRSVNSQLSFKIFAHATLLSAEIGVGAEATVQCEIAAPTRSSRENRIRPGRKSFSVARCGGGKLVATAITAQTYERAQSA